MVIDKLKAPHLQLRGESFMTLLKDIKEHLGWKIAILTSLVLFVVASLLVFTLSIIPVQFFSKFNLIQILAVSVILLTLVSVMAIYISTMIFVQRPLGKLLSVIRKAEKGDLNVRVKNECEIHAGSRGQRRYQDDRRN